MISSTNFVSKICLPMQATQSLRKTLGRHNAPGTQQFDERFQPMHDRTFCDPRQNFIPLIYRCRIKNKSFQRTLNCIARYVLGIQV